MQELEQEKEVLLQGLEMMARGRDWYQQQLQRVQERQRRLSQSRASAVSDAAQGRAVPAPRQRGAPCTCRKHPDPSSGS